MVRENILRILNLPESLDSLSLIVPPPLIEQIDLARGEQPDARVGKQAREEAAALRARMIKTARSLDARLETALRANRVSMVLRYFWITAVAVLMMLSLAFLVGGPSGSRLITASGVGLSVALLNWPIRQLQRLQDERICLMMAVKRFEPLILTSPTTESLHDVAARMYTELSFLGKKTV